MTWRLAKSLAVLRDQVNALVPNRSKAADGTIGDEAHSNRTSDHNPDEDGVVRAMDLTHDPARGFDSYLFAEHLRQKRDPRIKYVISNSRIFSATESPYVWRKYTGTNKHDHHVHVSVNKASCDYTIAWDVGAASEPVAVASSLITAPVLSRGARGDAVEKLQAALKIEADGVFGPKTVDAVKAFQGLHKLVADGIVGPYTWQALA